MMKRRFDLAVGIAVAVVLCLAMGGCTTILGGDNDYHLTGGGGTGGGSSSTGGSCVPEDDGNPCTDDICDNGTPIHQPSAADAMCSTGGPTSNGHFCDGAGSCVECNHDTQCSGVTNDCTHPACDSHVCGTHFTDAMTPTTSTPAQVPHDCRVTICDGNGDTMVVDDDMDLPDDNNACTDDICASGVLSHANKSVGTVCAIGGDTCMADLLCNAADPAQCAGCTEDCQCNQAAGHQHDTCGGGNPGASGVCGCTKQTCAQLEFTCGPAATDACYSTQNCDSGTKNGDETDADCGGPVASCATRCAQGKQCLQSSDCTSGFCVDGVCCNSPCADTCEACSAAKKESGDDGTCGAVAVGTDPDSECDDQGVSSCGNNGHCDGAGACQKYPAGTECRASAGVCDVAEICSGNGVPCPADSFASAAITCRVAADICDVAENCDGNSVDCPFDIFLPSTITCRMSAGDCDVAEKCTGTTASCPANGFVDEGLGAGNCDVFNKAACSGTGFCAGGYLSNCTDPSQCASGLCFGGTCHCKSNNDCITAGALPTCNVVAATCN